MLRGNKKRSVYTDGKLKIGYSQQNRVGFSLIEMLVVIFVFAILGVVSTQILAISLRSSKKSESIAEVRSNVEYAVSNMERLLRSAKKIDRAKTTSSKLVYRDVNDKEDVWFDCTNNEISSGSGVMAGVPITSESVEIDCSSVFTLSPVVVDVPDSVVISVTGWDAELGTSVEGASVTVQTMVQLRSYDK